MALSGEEDAACKVCKWREDLGTWHLLSKYDLEKRESRDREVTHDELLEFAKDPRVLAFVEKGLYNDYKCMPQRVRDILNSCPPEARQHKIEWQLGLTVICWRCGSTECDIKAPVLYPRVGWPALAYEVQARARLRS